MPSLSECLRISESPTASCCEPSVLGVRVVEVLLPVVTAQLVEVMAVAVPLIGVPLATLEMPMVKLLLVDSFAVQRATAYSSS